MKRFLFGDFESFAGKAAVFSRRLLVFALPGFVWNEYIGLTILIVAGNLIFGAISFKQGKSSNNEVLRNSGIRSIIWGAIFGVAGFLAVALVLALAFLFFYGLSH